MLHNMVAKTKLSRAGLVNPPPFSQRMQSPIHGTPGFRRSWMRAIFTPAAPYLHRLPPESATTAATAAVGSRVGLGARWRSLNFRTPTLARSTSRPTTKTNGRWCLKGTRPERSRLTVARRKPGSRRPLRCVCHYRRVRNLRSCPTFTSAERSQGNSGCRAAADSAAR